MVPMLRSPDPGGEAGPEHGTGAGPPLQLRLREPETCTEISETGWIFASFSSTEDCLAQTPRVLRRAQQVGGLDPPGQLLGCDQGHRLPAAPPDEHGFSCVDNLIHQRGKLAARAGVRRFPDHHRAPGLISWTVHEYGTWMRPMIKSFVVRGGALRRAR